MWRLRIIVTHPDFERRGIGGMLMEWGLNRSREDDIPCVLEASPVGENLYLRKGFKIVAPIKVTETLTNNAMIWLPGGGTDWESMIVWTPNDDGGYTLSIENSEFS